LQVINFIGTIYTGQGRGKFFIELPWVMQQLKKLTGFTPYFGTLNLHLTPESTEQRTHLTPQNGMLIKPKNDYLPGYLYSAKIFDVACYVVLPYMPNYPRGSLEIVATENLRNKFNIKDGDTITVSVNINLTRK
jgi:riboflavin kinase